MNVTVGTLLVWDSLGRAAFSTAPMLSGEDLDRVFVSVALDQRSSVNATVGTLVSTPSIICDEG